VRESRAVPVREQREKRPLASNINETIEMINTYLVGLKGVGKVIEHTHIILVIVIFSF